MKIAFKKRNLNSNLFYGLIFTLIGLIILRSNENSWYAILSILLPMLFIAIYFSLKHTKYLTVDKGIIKINHLIGKQVKMAEINQIEKYAGKYIIKTDKKTIYLHSYN
jgi:c-di-AMP phosphodiesterase-like protein